MEPVEIPGWHGLIAHVTELTEGESRLREEFLIYVELTRDAVMTNLMPFYRTRGNLRFAMFDAEL